MVIIVGSLKILFVGINPSAQRTDPRYKKLKWVVLKQIDNNKREGFIKLKDLQDYYVAKNDAALIVALKNILPEKDFCKEFMVDDINSEISRTDIDFVNLIDGVKEGTRNSYEWPRDKEELLKGRDKLIEFIESKRPRVIIGLGNLFKNVFGDWKGNKEKYKIFENNAPISKLWDEKKAIQQLSLDNGFKTRICVISHPGYFMRRLHTNEDKFTVSDPEKFEEYKSNIREAIADLEL